MYGYEINEFWGLKNEKAKRFTAGSVHGSFCRLCCARPQVVDLQGQLSVKLIFAESTQNPERKWYDGESTGERLKLNKERECKQPAPVLQCKQSLCKVKSTERNGGLIKSKCKSFIFKNESD